ncbi:MAG: response regulator transcription factor [Saccharofermentans sp.]|jgi:DNA-binding response OmpR family regulator|nr:response regulator transcription factor [Saccharofermentans sp.]
MSKILIIDDDPAVLSSTTDMLRAFSFDVITAEDGRKGYEMATTLSPDVIVLDWMMPGYSGMQFISDFRAQGYKTPVLFLTAKNEDSDQIEALRAGADDYIPKPFKASVLRERVRAMIRRSEYNSKKIESAGNRHEYCGGELIIDGDQMQAFKHDESCDLTNREFQLLQYLEQNCGRVCSRSELLKQVWKFDFLGDERTVDVTIKRTRQKIEPDQKNFKYILTRRGFGYFFPNDLT